MVVPSQTLSIAIEHYNAGNFHLAEQLATELLAANAQNGDAWQLLGAVSLQGNNRDRGLDCLNRALQCDMANADAWKALGDFYRMAGDKAAAIRNYQQAIRLRPDCADAYDALGCVYWDVPNWSKASAAFKAAARLKPDDPEIAFHLADFLLDCGRADQALPYFRQTLRQNPLHPIASTRMGIALAEQGFFEEAIVHMRASLARRPNQPNVYYFLSHLAAEGFCELTAEELERIRAVAGDDAFSPAARSDCAFALAALCQKQGSYDAAMHFFHVANGLKLQVLREQNIVFEARRHEALIERIISKYDRHYFERTRGWGLATDVPVFIVGMPRSGSTLVDQILANHPHVFSLGEAGDCQTILKQFTSVAFADPFAEAGLLTPSATQQLAAAYVKWITRPNPAATRVINKTLDNFLYLGLIATLFPRARIIHCRREPYDVCLSCYFANFKTTEFSNSLDDIGVYYRAYCKLMAHWASVLPLQVHEACYEDLVRDPEPEVRKLIAYCGLEWDDACLEYYKSHRVVRTASTAQVRRPIHKQAVGRWRHYRDHLGPLIEALGAPFGETVACAAAPESIALAPSVPDCP